MRISAQIGDDRQRLLIADLLRKLRWGKCDQRFEIRYELANLESIIPDALPFGLVGKGYTACIES